MSNRVRTRIAPSPTGVDLHIGNAYTALINYVFAKKHGGDFIVRIEDTDRTRFVPGSEKSILASLTWLGISYDEGPYHQSERLDIYKKHAEELVKKGHAYYCFCTPERLAQMRKDQEAKHEPPMYDGHCKKLSGKKNEQHVIRLNVPDEGITTFHDVIRGEISFENKLIDDQVILKSDGYPTYHLGVVVDDYLMEISHVIRGEEWISSTPKHILLYQFFGWKLPIYAHMPLLRNPDKSKLSKRKNPVWVSWYKEQGFLPEAVVNYLATLAWAHPEAKEIFSFEEMMKAFTLEAVQTTAPVFDKEKLRWMNKQYLMRMDQKSYVSYVSNASIYKNSPNFTSNANATILQLQPRAGTVGEYDSMIGSLYKAPDQYETKLNISNLGTASEALASEKTKWEIDIMENSIRNLAAERNQEAKDVFMDLRVAVTGKKVGPPLLDWIQRIGRNETLNRLELAKKKNES